jgi:DNA polymerase III delta prime subunit
MNKPFVEKYRPNLMNEILMTNYNSIFINNVVKNDEIPNILLYGPPGTGKTTTILNMINDFNKNNNTHNQECIHLNASDDRGIENIRTTILKYVSSKPLFNIRHKFVILDEVDYMTEQAQFGLKILLEEMKNNVTFFLICNYLSKLNKSLSNKFIKIKFDKINKPDIINRLKYIADRENIQYDNKNIEDISAKFKNDIRSMINYMQLHKERIKKTEFILTTAIIEIISKLITIDKSAILNYFLDLENKYNESSNCICKCIVKHVLINKPVKKEEFDALKAIIHNEGVKCKYKLHLFVSIIKKIYILN